MSASMKRKTRSPRSARKREEKANIVKYVCKEPNASEKNLIRKSLFDYERDKMIERGFVLYMQRVFIFVKNLPAPESVNVSQQSSAGDDGNHLTADGTYDEHWHLRRLTPHQTTDDEQMMLHTLVGKTLEMTLRKRLEKIVRLCNRSSITEDRLTGLFLYMGEYSLIVLEGTEDAIEIFCSEFNKRFSDFWANNKVFLVEDNIRRHYFDSFVSKSVHPMYMNHKLPHKKSHHEHYLAKQHRLIKHKLQSLCRKLIRNFSEQEEEEGSLDDNELELDEHLSEEHLEEPLAKHIPEVQRIELVLQSHRFYRNIKEFAKRNCSLPTTQEDEEISWPLRNNYTPFGAYMKSMFDYNFTYPEYNLTAEEKERRQSKFVVRVDEDLVKDFSEEEDNEETSAGDFPSASVVQSNRSLALTTNTVDD